MAHGLDSRLWLLMWSLGLSLEKKLLMGSRSGFGSEGEGVLGVLGAGIEETPKTFDGSLQSGLDMVALVMLNLGVGDCFCWRRIECGCIGYECAFEHRGLLYLDTM